MEVSNVSISALWSWSIKIVNHYYEVKMTEQDWDDLLACVERNKVKFTGLGLGQYVSQTMDTLLDVISQRQKGMA